MDSSERDRPRWGKPLLLAITFIFLAALWVFELTRSWGVYPLTDGAFEEGTHWAQGRRLLSTEVVEIPLGSTAWLGLVRVQVDGNDRYRLEGFRQDGSEGGAWPIPRTSEHGLRTRTISLFPPRHVAKLTVTPESGDGRYSIAVVEARFSIAPVLVVFSALWAIIATISAYILFRRRLSRDVPADRQSTSIAEAGSVALGALTVFLYRLSSTPPGVDYFDVCVNLENISAILRGEYSVFVRGWAREMGVNYLGAFFSLFSKNHFFALKTGLAVQASIAVLILYLSVRCGWSRFAALGAASVLTFSFWYTNLLRSGYRASLSVLAFTIVLNGVVRARRHVDGPRGAKVVGLVVGVGFSIGIYVYTVFVTFTLFAVLALAAALRMNQKLDARSRLASVAVAIALTLTLTSPFLYFIVNHPDEYFVRQQQRSAELLEMGFSGDEIIGAIAENYGLSQRSLFGDGSFRFEVGPEPLYLLPLFLWGVSRLLIRRGNESEALFLGGTLLLSPVASSIMSAGFRIEVPEFPRLVLSLPVIAVCVGLGVDWIRGAMSALAPRAGALAGAVLLVILTLAQAKTWYIRTFIRWPNERRFGNFPVHEWAVRVAREAGEAPVLTTVDLDRLCLAAMGAPTIENLVPENGLPEGRSLLIGAYNQATDFLPSHACTQKEANVYFSLFECVSRKRADSAIGMTE